MKQRFTPNSLVKYLYTETSASETLAIQEALREDEALRREYQELRRAYRQLPKVTFHPAKSTLEAIRNYNKQTAFERQC